MGCVWEPVKWKGEEGGLFEWIRFQEGCQLHSCGTARDLRDFGAIFKSSQAFLPEVEIASADMCNVRK
jgi:hypothetical protein